MNRIKKYWKWVLAVVVIIVLACLVIVGRAEAGGLKVFETALEVESDFTDIRATSLNDSKITHKGELDFDVFLINWDAVTGWDDGEFTGDVDGNIGAYLRLYTLKGGAFEFLGGLNQPIHDGLDKVRTLRFVVRKPL